MGKELLVNNAGILQQKPFEEITDEDSNRMFDVNMKETFLWPQEVLPHVKRQKHGKIINFSAVCWQFGGPKSVHYSATRSGIICFTKSLAKIASPFNINVNVISLGLIPTEMSKEELDDLKNNPEIDSILLKRIATIEDIANTAIFASSESDYITGQFLALTEDCILGHRQRTLLMLGAGIEQVHL